MMQSYFRFALLFFLIVSLFYVVKGQQKNHYKTLGLDPKASESEIKKAYRSLAKKLHPDKRKGIQKKEKEKENKSSFFSRKSQSSTDTSSGSDLDAEFIAVTEAYEVLSDPKKKEEYDEMLRYGIGSHHSASDANRHPFHRGGGGNFHHDFVFDPSVYMRQGGGQHYHQRMFYHNGRFYSFSSSSSSNNNHQGFQFHFEFPGFDDDIRGMNRGYGKSGWRGSWWFILLEILVNTSSMWMPLVLLLWACGCCGGWGQRRENDETEKAWLKMKWKK